MPRRNLQPRKAAKVELLPLMDMIFLLLVVFIFMIVEMRPDFGVSVELPEVSVQAAEKPDAQKAFVYLNITEAGAFFVNGQETGEDLIVGAVQKAVKESGPEKEPCVVIGADEACSHGQVMKLLELLRQNNFRDVVFNINVKK